jgi:hypothetical protein
VLGNKVLIEIPEQKPIEAKGEFMILANSEELLGSSGRLLLLMW